MAKANKETNIEKYNRFTKLKLKKEKRKKKEENSTKLQKPVVMYGCESWTVKKAEH